MYSSETGRQITGHINYASEFRKQGLMRLGLAVAFGWTAFKGVGVLPTDVDGGAAVYLGFSSVRDFGAARQHGYKALELTKSALRQAKLNELAPTGMAPEVSVNPPEQIPEQ
jgi:hypothetical protein